MKIDGNELATLQNDLDRRGQKQEAWKVKQEFLKQVRESGDHCPCQEKCPYHGKCFECVTLHRGHRISASFSGKSSAGVSGIAAE